MIKEEILAEMPEYWRECVEKYNRDGKCGSVMYSTVNFIPFFCKLLAAIEPEDETVRLVKTPLKDIKTLSDLVPPPEEKPNPYFVFETTDKPEVELKIETETIKAKNRTLSDEWGL